MPTYRTAPDFSSAWEIRKPYAVERCLKRMERAIAGYGGRTIEVSGDGLLAFFESAEKASPAAVDMQSRVSNRCRCPTSLTIRIGLHIGLTTRCRNGDREDGRDRRPHRRQGAHRPDYRQFAAD
ncbi:MAG: hypothetical protein IPG91_19680 [Ideonella sp.]|nr:hypothetical protein [Ideonella sp.]